MQMHDLVVLAKSENIERCIVRARKTLAASSDFLNDFDAQDIVVINLIRACEACIDLSLRLVKIHSLGLPNTSADGFAILARHNIIDRSLADKMTKMVGFRNVAVHEYTQLNFEIVQSVIQRDLDDVLIFIGKAITATPQKT
jgi:uncharacterized protein YutE (UPF0331/DUF86 family)